MNMRSNVEVSAKNKNYSNGITSELPQATKENLARNAQRLHDACVEVAAAFGMAVERVHQHIDDAIREFTKEMRHTETMRFLDEIARSVGQPIPSNNGVCLQQRRGRDKPSKRPFLQVLRVANNRKPRTDLKEFIRYGRAGNGC